MIRKKLPVIILVIVLTLSITLSGILVYKSINDSLKIYSLEFLLSNEKNDKKKVEEQLKKLDVNYDRYDALKQLLSLTCLKGYGQGTIVNEANDPNYWLIKLSGHIDNPETDKADDSYVSTLGNYLVNKNTGQVLDIATKSPNICEDLSAELPKVSTLIKSQKCVSDFLNEKTKNTRSYWINEISDDGTYKVMVYEDIGTDLSQSYWFTVNTKNSKVIETGNGSNLTLCDVVKEKDRKAAEDLVLKRNDVKEFFKRKTSCDTCQKFIGSSVDSDDPKFIIVQVYENNGVNNATFGWYKVNSETKLVKDITLSGE